MRPEYVILNSKAKKEIYAFLNNQFGFSEKFQQFVLKNHKDKLFLVSSDFDFEVSDGIKDITYGTYFGELRSNELRLSIEGSQIIGPNCTKNIIELDDNQVKDWISGQDINIKYNKNTFIIVKNKLGDFLGCGKVKENILLNFIPKNRRVKIVDFDED